jgi:hypothetical protein
LNVWILYWEGSLITIAREIAHYKLHLVGLQGVRWCRGGTAPAGEYIFFYGNGNENHELGTEFFVYGRIISSAKMAEFVNNKTSYTILRGH